jgi:hypothetical protein
LTLLRCSFLSVYPSIHPSTRPWHIPSPTLWMGMVPTNSPVGLQIIIRIYKPTIGWYHGYITIDCGYINQLLVGTNNQS